MIQTNNTKTNRGQRRTKWDGPRSNRQSSNSKKLGKRRIGILSYSLQFGVLAVIVGHYILLVEIPKTEIVNGSGNKESQQGNNDGPAMRVRRN